VDGASAFYRAQSSLSRAVATSARSGGELPEPLPHVGTTTGCSSALGGAELDGSGPAHLPKCTASHKTSPSLGGTDATPTSCDSACVVVGEIRVDVKTEIVDKWPEKGGTTRGQMRRHLGGRGGNEAIAVRRLGVPTFLVGCVGNDDNGELLCNTLAKEGIEMEGVAMVEGLETRMSVLLTSTDRRKLTVFCESGDASAVALQQSHDVRYALEVLARRREHSRVCLMPLQAASVLIQVAREARELGYEVLLKAAPLPTFVEDARRFLEFGLVDIVIANE
jgi:sugar/nucleoside kinase (ribokinase family)